MSADEIPQMLRGATWCGRSFDDLSREELLHVIEHLMRNQRVQDETFMSMEKMASARRPATPLVSVVVA